MKFDKVRFGSDEVVIVEVLDGTGARINKFACNIKDKRQGLKILNVLQYKYGFLENIEFKSKDGTLQTPVIKEEKGFLEY